jgi:hypothetical protein
MGLFLFFIEILNTIDFYAFLGFFLVGYGWGNLLRWWFQFVGFAMICIVTAAVGVLKI